jgi:hypothetical protein
MRPGFEDKTIFSINVLMEPQTAFYMSYRFDGEKGKAQSGCCLNTTGASCLRTWQKYFTQDVTSIRHCLWILSRHQPTTDTFFDNVGNTKHFKVTVTNKNCSDHVCRLPLFSSEYVILYRVRRLYFTMEVYYTESSTHNSWLQFTTLLQF